MWVKPVLGKYQLLAKIPLHVGSYGVSFFDPFKNSCTLAKKWNVSNSF